MSHFSSFDRTTVMIAGNLLFRRAAYSLAVLLGVASTLSAGGCGGKAVQKVVKKAQAAAKQVTQAVQTANKPAKASVALKTDNDKDKAITSNIAVVETAVFEGRPTVVKITSYEKLDKVKFPALSINARADEKSIGELSGKTIPAHMFFRLRETSTLWFSPPEKPAMITIERGDNTYVTAKLENAELVDARGQTIKLSGTVTALAPRPDAKKAKADNSEE